MGVTLDMFNLEDGAMRVPAGETIFAAGDPGTVMYVVLEGEVELRVGGALLEVLGKGEPFGEMALIDEVPRVATAIAKTDCRLAYITERRFLMLTRQTPFFAIQIMRVMADRLRKMNRGAMVQPAPA